VESTPYPVQEKKKQSTSSVSRIGDGRTKKQKEAKKKGVASQAEEAGGENLLKGAKVQRREVFSPKKKKRA